MSEPADWPRVDRGLLKCRQQLDGAASEEDFQAIGHRCREILISLAQLLWNPERHPILDGISASPTDAKRLLEAYIQVELGSNTNEAARKFARASVDLASSLLHKRTATFQDAEVCLEATRSMVSLFGIVHGRRDATPPRETARLMEAARTFAADRITFIQMGGQLPTVLVPGPKLVIHVFPETAARESAQIDHRRMQDVAYYFRPHGYTDALGRSAIDGWRFWQRPQPSSRLNPESWWCSFVTNLGTVEIVSTLEERKADGVQPLLNGNSIEGRIVFTVDQIAEAYEKLGIDTPVAVQLGIMDVQGAKLQRRNDVVAGGFDRPFVALPELYFEHLTKPTGNDLRLPIDAMWRAAGYGGGSHSYERGDWAGYNS